MFKLQRFLILAAAATMSITVGCARGIGSSAGEYISPADAAKTVVLHVDNKNSQPMELRVIVDNQSYFVGSVSGSDSTSILLDPSFFPTGFMYVAGIPAGGRGRAIDGPLSASKGDRINFMISPALELSRARVVR